MYKVSDNQKIDLVKELRKQGRLDVWVRLGAKEKIKCRLIAVPLPEQIVNQRRRKAKENRNSKANHSKKYFELLGYGVYITNVEEGSWSPKEVMKAYRCRWYIEILFKGWKSHLKLTISLPERYMNKQRIELFFYMAFLMLTLVVMPLFTELQKRVKNKHRTVSILKLCSFVRSNMEAFISGKKCSHILKIAEYYCLYDHRKKRINAIEQIFFYHP
ncbi:MAG TPA: hypothetical protein DCS93_28850 [Microscillaceae bacterium]|nr:hypothetical protein [Microscillaceae bacterium]